MPATPYEYAIFAQQVYQTDGGVPPSGWEVYTTSDTFGLSDPYGYYAAAYRNTDTNELIIAHRGTVPPPPTFPEYG